MAKKLDIPNAEDEALVRAAQRGAMPPYEELVHRHRDKIYARAFSMLRNEEEALDLSQEAWVKGWQRLKQFKHNASFTTWMTRICINLCLDFLRKRKRKQRRKPTECAATRGIGPNGARPPRRARR